jgi:hypothetical protein
MWPFRSKRSEAPSRVTVAEEAGYVLSVKAGSGRARVTVRGGETKQYFMKVPKVLPGVTVKKGQVLGDE